MKRIILSLAATSAAIALAPAADAAIYIGVSYDGGATITQVATGASSANYNTISNGFSFNVNGTGFPLLTMPELDTQSINIRSDAGKPQTIDVYVTQTDLAALNAGLTSSFTSNTTTNVTARTTSYYSASNALFGGTQLQSAPLTGLTIFSGSNNLNVAGPWSETVRYSLSFGGGSTGNFNGTANLTAVPEPATWGLMLLGFGAMGGMLRTRRRPAARIRFA